MINFPTKVTVTEQEVDLSALSDGQKEYFLNLKDRLVEIYENTGKDRVAVSLSGISGTGKSTIAVILTELLKQEDHDFAFYTCTLDAFHYTNDYLDEKQLRNVKGRYDTYDTQELPKTLQEFNSGKTTIFPGYSRKIHNPVDGDFAVGEDKALLLMEGLWFLRDDETWGEIRKEFAHNIYIEADEEHTKESVISRHVLGGRSKIEAESFYDSSDHLNTLEIQNNSVPADAVIGYYKSHE